MSVARDPEQAETRLLLDLAAFAGKDALEVGCGEGRLTWRYADLPRSVLALDPNMAYIETARAELPESLRDKVTFEVADILTAQVPHEAFDIVVFSWSLC